MPHTSVSELLRLDSSPVAVTFTNDIPTGVPPGGAHTHNVELSDDERRELMSLINTMVGLSDLKMEEIVHANNELEKFHRDRAAAAATS